MGSNVLRKSDNDMSSGVIPPECIAKATTMDAQKTMPPFMRRDTGDGSTLRNLDDRKHLSV